MDLFRKVVSCDNVVMECDGGGGEGWKRCVYIYMYVCIYLYTYIRISDILNVQATRTFASEWELDRIWDGDGN